MAYQKILVGIDGSKQSDEALQKAIAVAKQNQAELYLLSVVNEAHHIIATQSSFDLVDRDVMYDRAVEEMQKILAEKQAVAKKAGIQTVHTEVRKGLAKVELADKYPHEKGIDLIVIGASGLNAIGRLIVGSTATYVIRVAPCDVTVVKTDLDNQP